MMAQTVKFVFALCLSAAVVRASPHPNLDFADLGFRYSNDLYEDARLDVPELVRKYNYTLEVHEVTTSDGYILQMHRIPHGRDNQNTAANCPTVFIMHGLLSSSADFVNMGPGKGLGYIMADECYDVWMGNARGTYYSRRHLWLQPDATRNTEFWDFSWHEIGFYDLPAMIDYILDHKNIESLHYVGHSQGTTAFWVFGASRPEYNRKIKSMHAMAPVCYMGNVESTFLRIIAPFSHSIETLSSMIGIGEFLPNTNVMTWAGQAVCADEVVFQPLCTNIIFLIAGHNEDQLNTTMFPVKIGHTPAGSSTKQFAHYGQGITSGKFRRYDYGRLTNRKIYGSFTPPSYDLAKITAPTFLHYSDSDPLAHVKDVDKLASELSRNVGKFRVQQSTFSHVDFMWGIDAKTLVYDRIINLINAMD